MRKTFRLNLHGIGLGDVVAAVATPIARAVGADCIDPKTKELRPDSGCGRRKAALNAAVPSLNPLDQPVVRAARAKWLAEKTAAAAPPAAAIVENSAKIATPGEIPNP